MKLIARTIPVALAVVGIVSVYVWLSRDAGGELAVRLPGADGRPTVASRVSQARRQLLP